MKSEGSVLSHTRYHFVYGINLPGVAAALGAPTLAADSGTAEAGAGLGAPAKSAKSVVSLSLRPKGLVLNQFTIFRGRSRHWLLGTEQALQQVSHLEADGASPDALRIAGLAAQDADYIQQKHRRRA